MAKSLNTIVVLFFLWSGADPALAADPGLSDGEDTMLMFVGESLDAMTIASRREESAWQAPAVAQVISREQLFSHGYGTVGRALASMPGFHLAEKPWGTTPYLRGISNSTLFLYDTVPLDADSDKTVHQLDENLSLASIKRIEIIRGPGSVLWGPDAFAGIVNLVPMTGRDLDGVETGASFAPGEQGGGFYVNMGHGGALWDGFFSLSGSSLLNDGESDIVRFWGEDPLAPVPVSERYGNARPGRSEAVEASAQFGYRDRVRISGRVSDTHDAYAISDQQNGTWIEERGTQSSFVKLEVNRPLDLLSTVRLTGFYTLLRPQYMIIDREFVVTEKTSYAELIYDRSLFTGSGLLTGGISFREKRVKDAPVWESYLPEFLGPGNTDLLPLLFEENYGDSLWSGFAQYSHTVGRLKAWLGMRFDDHDLYQDNMSYNSGIGYAPSSTVITKLLYGTAYRTPSSRQLFVSEKPPQEKIATVEALVGYSPSRMMNFTVVAFTSTIEDHIKEDPYAQLSLPNRQEINGIELEGRVTPKDNLSLSANLTVMDNSGPSETYHLLSAVYVRPDGSLENIYEDIESPYDTGPKTIFNLAATWSPFDALAVVADLNYVAPRHLILGRTGETREAPSRWVMDLTATVHDVIQGYELSCEVGNLFDTHYQTPGVYGLIDGDPFSLTVILRKKW
ncbi:MAG: TonB-dependent receptor [Proteobacteria bacterium]|nr:TonB-dependent receptor [Pseudomonadota bacterium]MBU1686263.1 TonB-dependent receptor [Pseudomonadota bacterium]